MSIFRLKIFLLIFAAFLWLGFRHGWMLKATDGCMLPALITKQAKSLKISDHESFLIYSKAAIQIGFEKSNFLSPSYGHFLKKVRFLKTNR